MVTKRIAVDIEHEDEQIRGLLRAVDRLWRTRLRLVAQREILERAAAVDLGENPEALTSSARLVVLRLAHDSLVRASILFTRALVASGAVTDEDWQGGDGDE